jgi:Notch-like protein
MFPDIDECASTPCENDATCEDGVNSYTCKCKAGFNGKNCEKGEFWKNLFLMPSELKV